MQNNYIKNLVLSAVAIYKNLEEECEDKEILESSLKNALGGIKNLKITYGEDASIIASFEVLDERITRCLRNST